MIGAANIMAHMVAFYPDRDTSFQAGLALIEGGAAYLEIQFPFTDPTADGPLIQNACQTALAGGFTVDGGFSLAEELAGKAPVFIMTYGNLAFTCGIDRFTARARDAGVRGLIIPDLCPPEDEGLFEAGRRCGIAVVPVAAPAMSAERIRYLKDLKPEFIYAALRKGVTGKETDTSEALGFIEKLKGTDSKILAGFGIKTREQVTALRGSVHALVVGSLFVETIARALRNPESSVSLDLRKKMTYLCRGSEKEV